MEGADAPAAPGAGPGAGLPGAAAHRCGCPDRLRFNSPRPAPVGAHDDGLPNQFSISRLAIRRVRANHAPLSTDPSRRRTPPAQRRAGGALCRAAPPTLHAVVPLSPRRPARPRFRAPAGVSPEAAAAAAAAAGGGISESVVAELEHMLAQNMSSR